MIKSDIKDGTLTVTVTGECEGCVSAPRIISVSAEALDVRKRADDLHDEILEVLQQIKPEDRELARKVSQLIGAMTAPELDEDAAEAYLTSKIADEQAKADKAAQLMARMRKCEALSGCWHDENKEGIA